SGSKIIPRGGGGGEVGVQRQLTIYIRGGGVIGAPEVIDIGGMETGARLDFDKIGVGGDQHGYGTGTLGRLSPGVQRIACDVGGNHENLFFRCPGNRVNRHLQRGSSRIARLFEFNGAHIGGQTQQLVEVDAGGLGLVDRRFGGEQDLTDLGNIVACQQCIGGFGSNGDGGLVGRRPR